MSRKDHVQQSQIRMQWLPGAGGGSRDWLQWAWETFFVVTEMFLNGIMVIVTLLYKLTKL